MKHTMKKVLALVLAVGMICGMVACGSKEEEPAKKSVDETEATAAKETTEITEKEKIKIGVSYAMLNEMKMLGHELFMEAVDSFNAQNEDVEVEIMMTNADNSADKQIADIETLMASDCDVIRVDALDVIGAVSICEQVHDAGIPVLEVHGVQSDKIDVMGTGFDHASMGMIYAAELEKLLEADPELKLNIGYLQGNPAMSNTLLRIAGAEYLEETYPDRVKILDVKYANFKTDEAMAIMEDWLQAYPEMNCVCSSSDDMAIGAVNVLKSADRIDEFIITGIDGTEAAINAVESGEMLCTVLMNQKYVQEKWLEICVQLARGETVEHKINLGTSALFGVTKDNIEEARKVGQ